MNHPLVIIPLTKFASILTIRKLVLLDPCNIKATWGKNLKWDADAGFSIEETEKW